MKGKRIFACLLGGIFASAAIAYTGERYAANASTIKLLTYEDNFDSSALDSAVWHTTAGVEHQKEYSALRLNAIGVWGQYVNLQKQALNSAWEHFTIDITADWLDTKSGWTGIFFGNPSATGLFNNSKYFLHLSTGADKTTAGSDESGTGIRLSPKITGASGFESKYGKSQFHTSDVWKQGDLSEGGQIVYMRLQFDKVEGTEGDDAQHILTLKWGFSENDLSNVYVFDKQPMDVDGYMGFTTYGSTVFEMRNFKLTADGEELLTDDFTAEDISYPSLSSGATTWRCVGVTEDNVYCGNICSVNFDGVSNGSLIYMDELAVNPYSTTNFEMSYEIGVENITEDTYVGSGFGLTSLTDKVDKNGFIGFRKVDGEYRLALVKNGAVQGEESAFTASGLKVSLKFVGYYDGSIAVYVNGKLTATYQGLNFLGYTSISAYSLVSGAQGNMMSADNFSLYEYESIFAENGDYRINFKGRKENETPGGSIRKDFWFNNKKWVKFGEAKEPNLTINQNRNYIMFQDTRMESGFAPKEQFGDFIARFDFKVSSLDDTSIMLAPFGFSFGRENLASTSKSAPGVYFEPITVSETNPETGAVKYTITGTRVVGLNMTTAGGGTSATLTDLNVFANTDDWYTCMIVMSNRTAKVYLKKTNDGSDDFGKPVIIFTNVDAHGYVAVTYNPSGSNYAYYWATNISVIGIDLLQKEADE
ncbi:MAG: hypothetical protein IJX49_02255 [Clostridia bacterium]|nr:hypothetical protein [Clostridia bacterium]